MESNPDGSIIEIRDFIWDFFLHQLLIFWNREMSLVILYLLTAKLSTEH
jgi:hypothetical protein